MRKIRFGEILFGCLLALVVPVSAFADDHEYQTTMLGRNEALIIDSKTGDIWEFTERGFGGPPEQVQQGGPPFTRGGPSMGSGGHPGVEGAQVKYLGKLHPGQKAGEVIIENGPRSQALIITR